MDNLESQTYEAFEKDPVKYRQYERAIVKALELEKEKEGVDTTVLMVSRDGGEGRYAAVTDITVPSMVGRIAGVVSFLDCARRR